MINYDNSCCIGSREQLAIKGKENIDLAVRDMVLSLLDALYVLSFTVNLISTIRFWRNNIGVYFSAS